MPCTKDDGTKLFGQEVGSALCALAVLLHVLYVDDSALAILAKAPELVAKMERVVSIVDGVFSAHRVDGYIGIGFGVVK